MGLLRPLAIVQDYFEMQAAYRRYLEEINVSRGTIDHVAGWADGLAGKLFAPNPVKGIGRDLIGPFLQSVGLVLIVAQDVGQFERMHNRLPERTACQVRPKNQCRRNHPKAKPEPQAAKKRRGKGKYE